MLLVKGRANSSNVMKALWILDEIGIEYEREDVGGTFGCLLYTSDAADEV